jgi:hypothetical protein
MCTHIYTPIFSCHTAGIFTVKWYGLYDLLKIILGRSICKGKDGFVYTFLWKFPEKF